MMTRKKKKVMTNSIGLTRKPKLLFLRLPIEDPYLEAQKAASNKSIMFPNAENPLAATLAFLASVIKVSCFLQGKMLRVSLTLLYFSTAQPSVAAAAAKSAMTELARRKEGAASEGAAASADGAAAPATAAGAAPASALLDQALGSSDVQSAAKAALDAAVDKAQVGRGTMSAWIVRDRA